MKQMMVLANTTGWPGIRAAAEALEQGRSALHAVEAGIRLVETEPRIRTVGYGGAPNLLGIMECDAALMDGHTLMSGAVGALCGYLHPVTVAKEIMQRLPHVMLVGEGAARFAQEIGAEEAEMLSEEAATDYTCWINEHVPADARAHLSSEALIPYTWPSARPDIAKGTTVWLAIDSGGQMAGGTSTSGWAYKYPGRLGDSPIIGAGLYVDERYGACACTHTGEMTIRAGSARSVVLYMKMGASVQDACQEALDDLAHLQGGYLGTVVIHAIDHLGTPCVVSNLDGEPNPEFWFWCSDMEEPRALHAPE